MILESGSVSLLYQNGFLRYISENETELLRMIYFALRDENWQTIPLEIENEQIKKELYSFEISYTAYNVLAGERIYQWEVLITGSRRARIEFHIKGKALKDQKKNRAGFCILHPLTYVTSQRVEIVHPDGSSTKGLFPTYISPDTPFTNISAIRWVVRRGEYRVDLTGDIFEMEDQRNWGDASYKTYCTPISQPFPVELRAGDTVEQSVAFYPEGYSPFTTGGGKKEVTLRMGELILPIPATGTGVSTEIHSLSDDAISQLRGLGLNHYRVEVTPSENGWTEALNMHAEVAYKMGTRLEVALHLSDDYDKESDLFFSWLNRHPEAAAFISVLSTTHLTTPSEYIKAMRAKLQVPDVLLGCGTDYNFTELNRFRPDELLADYITYSAHPQEHATDDLTIIENTEAQYHASSSVQHLFRDRQVLVSPVTLRRRFNPYSSDPTQRIKSDDEKADPRQGTRFTSAFTFGYIKAAARAGAHYMTLFQTIGRQGIISAEGQPYPVFDLIAEFKGNASAINIMSTDPLRCEALYLREQNKFLVANMTATLQKAVLPDTTRVELEPYETCSVINGMVTRRI